eukprot:TRINITY_DN143_c0_g1_i4.p1 TRINITY_DN143_c0_g1~~TRINITY_DN143_c0_g1_i4.p1  ORF type:complete len:439 (-),score=190.25 TRINITY_DN143_c0_g1_i4:118-1434(-)
MLRRPPRSTQSRSSAASDVYKRQINAEYMGIDFNQQSFEQNIINLFEMSHCKYEQPRHGSLAFLPRCRTKKRGGKIRSFPKDKSSDKCHLTAFAGFKVGMTHILRDVDKPGSKWNKKEVIEATTIIECPPIMIVGMVGYIETPRGLRALSTVWASKLDKNTIRRFYKNWMSSKKKAFSKYSKKFAETSEIGFKRIKKYCTVVRVLATTQMKYLNLRTKKNHIFEVQINGGSIAQKVDFGKGLFEKEVRVADVFAQNEQIDVIGVTKGKGFCGVMKRFGVRHLQKKTHRGYRKVGCIGAWHPRNVEWTVARAGNKGFHHRTEINKKIYRIGMAERGHNGENKIKNNASTQLDLTEKNITPIGGFPHYGIVRDDFLLIKGCCVGPKKRMVLLRKTLVPQTNKSATEQINLKFIDTASKLGHGRFQTQEEKAKFYGKTKAK